MSQQAEAKEAKLREIQEGLTAALQALGHTVEWRPSENPWRPAPSLVLDQAVQYMEIGFDRYRYSRGVDIPRARIKVSDFPAGRYSIRQFPEPKAGFDFPKIARAVHDAREARIARDKREKFTRGRAKDAALEADGIYTAYGKPKNVHIFAYPDWDESHTEPQHTYKVEASWSCADGDAVHVILTQLRESGLVQ